MPTDSHEIILEPVVTEKSVAAAERTNTYTFRVATTATKGQVKRAVEELFGVHVVEVRTATTHSRRQRLRGRMTMTRSRRGKKAVVKLVAEDRIEIF